MANKINQYSLQQPINTAIISNDGQVIVFGIGYDWSKGMGGLKEVNYQPRIGYKHIENKDLKY